jgi:hypothetical protein
VKLAAATASSIEPTTMSGQKRPRCTTRQRYTATGGASFKPLAEPPHVIESAGDRPRLAERKSRPPGVRLPPQREGLSIAHDGRDLRPLEQRTVPRVHRRVE